MEINIYAENLSLYVSGGHRGQWIKLPMDSDELDGIIDDILKGNEEILISDYEAPFKISEYENIRALNEYAERFMEVVDDLCEDDETIESVCKYIQGNGYDDEREKMLQVLENRDYTIVDEVYSQQDLAIRVDEDYLPFDYASVKGTAVENFLDWDAIGREMELDGWDIRNGIGIKVHS